MSGEFFCNIMSMTFIQYDCKFLGQLLCINLKKRVSMSVHLSMKGFLI